MSSDLGPGNPGEQSALRARPWLAVLVLLLAVVATYANGLGNGFVYDDQLVIVDDPAVRMPLSSGFAGLHYRPLRTFSYRVDHAIGGMDPRVFHASNVLYHALAVLLVHALLGALGASPGAALAGALVFAVHPVQADVVTYAAGRRDVLCGLFYALGVVAWLRHRRRGGAAPLVVAGVAYVLAILAKEMAVTMPVVCFVIDRWQRRRAPAGGAAPGAGRGARPGPYLAAIVVLGLVGALALAATYGGHVLRIATERPWHGGSFAANVATMARVFTKYLQLVVFPATLSVDYSYDAFPVSTGLADPRALASLALLGALAWAGARSWARGGSLGLGLAWMAVAILPVSHLIPFRELLAEHYLYIPLMGVAVIASGAVDGAAARWPERRRWLAAATALVVLALAARTVVRNRDFRDRVTLWTATVAVVPRCARAQFNLGQAHFEQSRFMEAERAWQAADAIQPDDADTNRGLASLYYRLGRHDEAAGRIATVLATKPRDGAGLTLAGFIALDKGDPDGALAYFDRALAVLPAAKAEGARRGRERAVRARPAAGVGDAP